MAMLKINGVAIKDPSTFNWGLSDLSSEESGRSTNDGKMNKDVIAQKRQLDITWANISPSDASTILKAVNYTTVGSFFSVTYPDTMEGTNLTKDFYVGDRKAPMKQWADFYNGKIYSTLSLSFIER